uniref:mitogen-activated protein kinase kinase n=1 Tax=Palpitomonas bilix TaxID=652834 RepID=A0A7S3G2Y6_9EUKA|mmetsp:Transcript_24630/g.62354  ORF Transcript_24630/g.62354 Transcript_24630/m.62354 type:complete len:304 (+) Transcript_24630:87-998(+)|eukprot:CAMPEP_0113890864 /NCGR_PEP_ID=MMETSP0780_2-20120614/14408_1 /TAXON_ID=652834 /ORGANISM="Palpitomonas bilix" /LENGTH=303 /DNA_ID=CAMNT_0000880359 /DNA_START=45 /DNA_END=956 /DNA_ORIENTATION=+ /assembly_acc=CAM_ASM_000599
MAYSLEQFAVRGMLSDEVVPVKVVQERNSGNILVLKSVPVNFEDSGTAETIVKEVKGQFLANDATVTSFYDSFYENRAIHIMMEYMDQGSLFDVYTAAGSIPEDVLATIAARALEGLAFLHHKREPHIIHRSIKPSNILLNHDGQVKLTDFGHSRQLDNSYSGAKTVVGGVSKTTRGFLCYSSPERINAAKYSYNSDIWSLGLSILEAATGRFPYRDVNEYYDLLDIIVDEPHPEPPAGASEEFVEFINKCLDHEPADRLETMDLLSDDKFIERGRENPVDLAGFLASLREHNPRYDEKFPRL